MKKIRTFRLLILTALCVASMFFSGCAGNTEAEWDFEEKFYIYYKSSTKAELYPVETDFVQQENLGEEISSLWAALSADTGSAEYCSPVPAELLIEYYDLTDTNLTLNFHETYLDMDTKEELLLRAAVVKTFCQLSGVSSVEIRVENQPLVLSSGKTVGPESAKDYVDIISSGLNSYDTKTITVYFTDEEGLKLYPESITLTYNTSKPVEQYIVNRLISGPQDGSPYFSVLPGETKLLSISTKNSVCYVNFDRALLTENLSVSPEILIYSVVNSLTELSEISSVQIMISGSSDLIYKDRVDLCKPLQRDLDYVVKTGNDKED